MSRLHAVSLCIAAWAIVCTNLHGCASTETNANASGQNLANWGNCVVQGTMGNVCAEQQGMVTPTLDTLCMGANHAVAVAGKCAPDFSCTLTAAQFLQMGGVTGAENTISENQFVSNG